VGIRSGRLAMMSQACVSEQSRRLRRGLHAGAILLVAGGGTTLGVAWLPAFVLLRYGYISHDGHWREGSAAIGRATYRVRRSELALSDWVQIYPDPLAGGGSIREIVGLAPVWAAIPEAGTPYSRVDTAATGWPWRALASESWQQDASGAGSVNEELRHNIRLATIGSGRIFLPLRPVWGGLLADIAVFAAGWGAVLTGPITIRRLVRRRRGLCPACGYTLGNRTTCSECGFGR
jgi:hypothetical protein